MRISPVIGVLVACGGDPAPVRRPPPIREAPPTVPVEPPPLGKLPTGVQPLRQRLVLAIDPAATQLSGTTSIAVELDRPRDVIWLHGRDLAVREVRVQAGGRTHAARWEQVDPDGVARVTVAAPVTGQVTLELAFAAKYDPQLVGVYKTATSAGPAVFSKFEAIYARRAFPCFDEPRFKIPFEVSLDVPDGAVAIGNMPVAATAGTRVTFQPTPPLPTYLVAFAVGPFETRETIVLPQGARRQPLPLRGVAVAGRGKDLAYALGEAPTLLARQERYFEVPFPYPKLDLIAVPDFQSGAMENAGAITFRDSALLLDERVTPTWQRLDIIDVVAHEIAHQWFGDLVTMEWWDDLWLNEGFATFLATRTVQAVHPELEADLDAVASANVVMDKDSLASARRIRQPIQTPHDITNAFDGITYQKGAAVLAMLEHYIGDEPFRRAISAHLTANAHGAVTTELLLAALSREAGRDLRPLAASFLDQPGVPSIEARLVCEGGKGRVLLSQTRWQPIGAGLADATWTVPVCVRAGTGGASTEHCTLLAERTGAIELPACADWVMPNARAAGYYRFTLPPAQLPRLRDQAKQLSLAERMAFAYALVAALRSGALPARDVLAALEPFARDPHGTIAAIPINVFRELDRDHVTGPDRAKLRARVIALYRPIATSLGWKPRVLDPLASRAPSARSGSQVAESAARRQLRVRVLGLLLDLGDPVTTREAARLGGQLLAAPATPIDPDLAALVLGASARAGDARTFAALAKQLTSAVDGQLRNRLLGAIASVRDPALVAEALALAFDPRLRATERLVIPLAMLGTPDTADAAWLWLQASFDRLLPLLPDRYGGRVPLAMNACDPGRVAEMRAFFTSRVGALAGGPRNLAQALETAQQCIANVDAARESVLAYVRGR